MHVIGHQAVAQNAEAMLFAVLGEQAQVEPAVGVVKKNLLTVIPPLRDVVRYGDRDHASDARHIKSFSWLACAVNIEAVTFLPPVSSREQVTIDWRFDRKAARRKFAYKRPKIRRSEN
jgi:hypothetical protein